MAGSRTRHIQAATVQTAGGIPYRRMPGYPVMTGSDERQVAEEKYLILASDACAFFAESFPAPVMSLTGAFLPQRRRMPNFAQLITKEVRFTPHDAELPWDPCQSLTTSNDVYCEATITYETGQEETVFERSVTGGGQFLSLPPSRVKIKDEDAEGTSSSLSDEELLNSLPMGDSAENLPIALASAGKFSADAASVSRSGSRGAANAEEEDNLDADLPVLQHIPTCEWELKWKMVPSPNFAWYTYHMGRVNSDNPALLGNPRRETCLFSGFSARQVFVWSGGSVFSQPWEIAFHFSQRIVPSNGAVYGWNHVYSPRKGRWVRVLRPDGSWLHPTMSVAQFLGV